MSVSRLPMRKIKEVLRLRFEKDLSFAEIARSISASSSTVQDYIGRAKAAGVGWPLPDGLDEAILESRLFPSATGSGSQKDLTLPDFGFLHREMRRKHVTLQLLWQEYKEAHPDDGYQYSQFCKLYRQYTGTLDVVMRQEHRAGEKAFVDFSGDGIPLADPKTGEVREAALFLAVLGASSYTYAEAFESEEMPCWITGHVHAFEHFQGVPAITVPDNTKTAVTHPCRYEPELNPTYLEMARHYGTAVIPARVRKPKDKALVEGGVLIAQRWIIARLRNHNFFSVPDINEAISPLLEELNAKPFQKLDGTRRELWETIDRPDLKPLPPARYEFAAWSKHRVNIDYHIEVERHYYSVPHQLIHKEVEARTTAATVEILFKGSRVWTHARGLMPGRYTTVKEHMPKSHQEYAEWTPSRLAEWAATIGPNTAAMVQKIMESRPHPEHGFRSCLGIMRLGIKFGPERVEAACARSYAIGSYSYKSVESILKKGLDRQPLKASGQLSLVIDHENVRGPTYYH